MAKNQPPPSLADYLVMAISPALIMALIGSLVFFLLDILYVGEYSERMQWTLFFFVFGAVLIARIAMIGEIANRSALYAMVLGILVWIALQTFVEYPPDSPAAPWRAIVNLGLIVLTWWCAKRLTWDCTYIDESVEDAGQGVLQSAGIDKDDQPAEERQHAKKMKKGLVAWWERCRNYRNERRKKQSPGVWIVYFSLAALPLFGLGQARIPAGEVERRRYAFALMILYVGSGLGLLLTTSFLGVRRYLRQRQLQMPAAVAGVWMGIGCALVISLLVVGAFLPRPHPEYPMFDILAAADSREQEASGRALIRGEAQKGDEHSQGGKGKPGEPEPKKGPAGSKVAGQEPNAKKSGPEGKPGGKDQTGKQPGKDGSEKGQEGNGKNNETGTSPPSTPGDIMSSMGEFGKLLQKIVFVLVALVVGFVVLRAVLQFLANFTGWAASLLDWFRKFWRGMVTIRQKGAEGTETAAIDNKSAPRPFAEFANPFHDGTAQRRRPEDLVRYSFLALQAWAEERGQGRRPQETPLEFAERLGEDVPALESQVKQLVDLVVTVAYAGENVAPSCVGFLQYFWQRLQSLEESPMTVTAE